MENVLAYQMKNELGLSEDKGVI